MFPAQGPVFKGGVWFLGVTTPCCQVVTLICNTCALFTPPTASVLSGNWPRLRQVGGRWWSGGNITPRTSTGLLLHKAQRWQSGDWAFAVTDIQICSAEADNTSLSLALMEWLAVPDSQDKQDDVNFDGREPTIYKQFQIFLSSQIYLWCIIWCVVLFYSPACEHMSHVPFSSMDYETYKGCTILTNLWQ